jgi:PAS domain S-box-containing protein
VDLGIILLLCVSLIYSLLSPGGPVLSQVTSIGSQQLGWGGTISLLQGEIDPCSIPLRLVLLAAVVRVSWIVLSSRTRFDRISVGLHLTCVMAAIVPIFHSFGLSKGWWGGIPIGEYTLSTLFVLLSFETFRQERARETAERERHAQLEAVLGHSLGFAGLLHPDGRLILANQVSLRAIDVSPAEVVGRPFSETPWWTHSPEAQARLRTAVAKAASGEADRFITTHRLPDGSELDIDFSLLPFRNPSGTITHLIAEGRDITEIRRYERKLREGSRLEAIGQLAGGIAHDFNNVLGGIMGAAELAIMRTSDPDLRRRLTTILSATGKAGDLTKRLLSYARKAKATEIEVHLNSTVRDMLELFSRVAGPAIRIGSSLQAEPDCTLGDPSELQSALLNLCINARDAMPDGGLLHVATAHVRIDGLLADCEAQPVAPGLYVRIDVSDEGTGIPANVLQHIFDPFFTTKPDGQGTGLGLPAVLGTARVHHGAVLIDTAEGRGTTISILLPATTPTQSHLAAPMQSAARGEGLVIVVDDEPSICAQAAELLVSLGFLVESFTDPLLARDRLQTLTGVRCLVFDLAMPRLNGLDLYRLVRASSPELPIIISSGYAGGGQLSDAEHDAHLGFLPKPWRLEQLRQRLVALGVLPPG